MSNRELLHLKGGGGQDSTSESESESESGSDAAHHEDSCETSKTGLLAIVGVISTVVILLGVIALNHHNLALAGKDMWLAWGIAALGGVVEASEAISMKFLWGFRSMKYMGIVTFIGLINLLVTYFLLQHTNLNMGWSIYTGFEMLGVLLASSFTFEESIGSASKVGIVTLFVGLVCLTFCEPPESGREKIEVGTLGTVVISCACVLVSIFMVWGTQKVRWTRPGLIRCFAYFALSIGVITEVATGVLLYSNNLLLGAFVGMACGYSTIVAVEFMDLHYCWTIYTGLEYSTIILLSWFYFGEVPSAAMLASLSIIFVSIIILTLGEEEAFEAPDDLPALEPQLSKACKLIESARLECQREGRSDRVVVQIGVGIVGKLVLRELSKMPDWAAVILVDAECPKTLMKLIQQPKGSLEPVFIQYSFVEGSFEELLDGLGLKPADVVVELGHDLPTRTFCNYCHSRDLHFVNAAISEFTDLYELMSCPGQVEVFLEKTASMRGKGATSVVLHGMNPGMVSHCAKVAVLDLANRKGFVPAAGSTQADALEDAAAWLRVEAIDVTEIDTQESYEPRGPRDYISTWSCVSFHDEMFDESSWWDGRKGGVVMGGMSAVENIGHSVGLGKEKLEVMSGYTSVHEEVFTIPLMFAEKSPNIKTRFVYQPTPQMSESLEASKWISYDNLKDVRTLRCLDTDTKPDGFDSVGAYVTTKDGSGQWVGLKLTAQQSWDTWGPIGQATSWLTALGIMIGVDICLRNPDLGVCIPEDLALEMVLPRMKPFLHSLPADKESPTVPTV